MSSNSDSFRINHSRCQVLVLTALATVVFGGCRVLSPVPIPNEKQYFSSELIDKELPQIEVGRKDLLLDSVGWVLGIPGKITLWDHRVDRHKISEPTLETMAHYLEVNNLPHVKVRANQYAPLRDFKRLRKNKTVQWPYRYTIGLVTLAQETLIPGRLFGGDHFNPYTQTIHLYSDIPAIAIHEGGHAKDFTRRRHQGLYSLAYGLLPLWHETIASEDAFAYIETFGSSRDIKEANQILYPAYGTYVGGALGGIIPDQSTPLYYASVVAGHINGRLLARNNNKSTGNSVAYLGGEDLDPWLLGRQEREVQDGMSQTGNVIRQVSFESDGDAPKGHDAPDGLLLPEDFLLGQPSPSLESREHGE